MYLLFELKPSHLIYLWSFAGISAGNCCCSIETETPTHFLHNIFVDIYWISNSKPHAYQINMNAYCEYFIWCKGMFVPPLFCWMKMMHIILGLKLCTLHSSLFVNNRTTDISENRFSVTKAKSFDERSEGESIQQSLQKRTTRRETMLYSFTLSLSLLLFALGESAKIELPWSWKSLLIYFLFHQAKGKST